MSGQRRGGDGEDRGEHGQDARVSDALVDAEADRERAAAGEQGSTGMADSDTDDEAQSHGRRADQREAQPKSGPVKGVDVGEEVRALRGGWRRGG